MEEKRRLFAYYEKIQTILMKNPYLDRKIGLGNQDFGDYIHRNIFYVDKTHFIIEFKVRNERAERDVDETERNALRQIEEKRYEIDLLSMAKSVS